MKQFFYIISLHGWHHHAGAVNSSWFVDVMEDNKLHGNAPVWIIYVITRYVLFKKIYKISRKIILLFLWYMLLIWCIGKNIFQGAV